MTELRSFTRQHLEGALALFAAEDWQTNTADPERTYRALATRSGGFYLGLGARRVPRFRLTRECLGLGGNDGPATQGLRGNDRAATDGGL